MGIERICETCKLEAALPGAPLCRGCAQKQAQAWIKRQQNAAIVAALYGLDPEDGVIFGRARDVGPGGTEIEVGWVMITTRGANHGRQQFLDAEMALCVDARKALDILYLRKTAPVIDFSGIGRKVEIADEAADEQTAEAGKPYQSDAGGEG